MADEAGASTTETETTEATAETTTEAERSFTTADVERIVKERLARHKATPPTDYEELKAAAAKLARLEAANQTELERAQAEATAAKAERETLAAEIRQTRLESAILAEAAKPARKIVDPEAAIDFLTGRDKGLVEIDADGNPTNIAKAMDSLLEARPFLVATGGSRAGSADQGARGAAGPGQLTREDLQKMSPAEIVRADTEGRLEALKTGSTA